ncbi:MAG: anthranilate phosphoribosyltransferase [Desulfovibrio sp.]|nr:anthranilate phosphoribosyltransferase [Desulfovibrio sp.]
MLERLGCREDLNEDMAMQGFELLFDGKMTPAQSAAFLMGLRAKGESPLELACAVKAALARAVKVEGIPDDALDIVGTGGDGRNSFNCSTCTALVLAGAGYHVVKHGNRAVSSKSGAADALEALGVPLLQDPAEVLQYLARTNFGFFFAPYAHPAFKNIGPIRRELGIRTLFNILGPMINPARTRHLMMGVAKPEMLDLVADTLLQGPYLRSCVLHGAGGYDEVTPMGPCRVVLLDKGEAVPMEIDPARYGIQPCTVTDLAVSSKEEAASVLRDLLQGRGPKAMRDMVALNAGLAIFLVEQGATLDECMAKGRAAVESAAGKGFVHA